MIIDTHAHYDDEDFLEDREEVFREIKKEGVGLVVNIGSTLASAKESVKLSEEYDFIYAAAGVHPSEVEELREEDMEWLFSAAKLQ